MFLSVNFRSVGQPVVRPRPSFHPVHPRMDFQKGGEQGISPHSRPLSRTRVYIIMYVSLTSARRAAAYFPTCGKRRRSVPRETFPHVGKRTATCVWATSNLKYISHNVFLGTLSRVINSFITRDKAPRGTLCNSNILHGLPGIQLRLSFCTLLTYSSTPLRGRSVPKGRAHNSGFADVTLARECKSEKLRLSLCTLLTYS